MTYVGLRPLRSQRCRFQLGSRLRSWYFSFFKDLSCWRITKIHNFFSFIDLGVRTKSVLLAQIGLLTPEFIIQSLILTTRIAWEMTATMISSVSARFTFWLTWLSFSQLCFYIELHDGLVCRTQNNYLFSWNFDCWLSLQSKYFSIFVIFLAIVFHKIDFCFRKIWLLSIGILDDDVFHQIF